MKIVTLSLALSAVAVAFVGNLAAAEAAGPGMRRHHPVYVSKYRQEMMLKRAVNKQLQALNNIKFKSPF